MAKSPVRDVCPSCGAVYTVEALQNGRTRAMIAEKSAALDNDLVLDVGLQLPPPALGHRYFRVCEPVVMAPPPGYANGYAVQQPAMQQPQWQPQPQQPQWQPQQQQQWQQPQQQQQQQSYGYAQPQQYAPQYAPQFTPAQPQLPGRRF